MKVLLVDDEPLARARMRRLLAELDDCDCVAEAANGVAAIAAWQQYQPDVILLDIRMPLMDGLEAARIMAASETPPAIIFCTAYGDYAIAAFAAQAVGYLLKPVARESLQDALHKARRLTRLQLSALDSSTRPARRSHLSSRSARGVELLALSELRYLQADSKYVRAVHAGGELLLDESLKELESEFADTLLRVHRNALVSVPHITGTQHCDDGLHVLLADIGIGPLVSRRHSRALMQWLRRL